MVISYLRASKAHRPQSLGVASYRRRATHNLSLEVVGALPRGVWRASSQVPCRFRPSHAQGDGKREVNPRWESTIFQGFIREIGGKSTQTGVFVRNPQQKTDEQEPFLRGMPTRIAGLTAGEGLPEDTTSKPAFIHRDNAKPSLRGFKTVSTTVVCGARSSRHRYLDQGGCQWSVQG